MKTKHTPGPWTLEYDNSLVMPCEDGNHIVTAGAIAPDTAPKEQRRANMDLIAAAPDLLQALREIVTEEGNIIKTTSLEKALKALHKANPGYYRTDAN